MRLSWILSSLALLALGCGSDGGSGADAGASTNTDAATVAADAMATVDAGGGEGCTGACATMDLTATFGETVRTFDRAFFGLTSPQNSDSGEWELYIENGAGADEECPSMKSPTPDYLFILASMPLQSADPGPITATANLIDFEGALLVDSIREEAASNSVTWVSYDPCVACAEGTENDRDDRHLAVDIEATFADGSISGHAYATHCDSLDNL